MTHQIAVLLFCSLTALIHAAEPSAHRKPNVLLICVDDLKPLLGCYASPQIKTPHIDRLAARGLLFERAYCNQAVCAPSRNALMTGLRPSTLGIYDLGTNFRKSRPDAVTLAQTFLHAGYRTEAMGKIMHVGHGNTEDEASWSVAPWKPQGSGYLLPQNQELQKQNVARAKAAGLSMEKIANQAKGPATECADFPRQPLWRWHDRGRGDPTSDRCAGQDQSALVHCCRLSQAPPALCCSKKILGSL